MPATQPRTSGDLQPSRWPGERLGLPESGPGSVGRVGRRIAALAIDWAAAIVIALLFAPYSSMLHSWLTLGIFALMQILFIPTIGGSVGHRLVGLRVVPITGGWVGPWRPIVRTALLVIVLPALVWDSDQRGFHDKVAGTVLIRA
ncbi:RDD family protein [Agromyces bauzanensis]